MSQKLLAFAFIGFCCVSYATAPNVPSQNQCFTCRGINCLRTTVQEVTESCVYDLDVCVTIFNKFTVEAKGCLLNMPVELRSKCNDKSNPECQICSGDLCNNLGRKDFKCYECNESDDLNCTKNITALTPVQCKIPSAPNSYCYTEKTSTGTRRGCSLHVKDQKACLNNVDCQLCNVEDGQACNAIDSTSMSGAANTKAAMALIAVCASIARMILF